VSDGTICPRCGDPLVAGARDPERGGAEVCLDCYFEEFDLVDAPDRVEIDVCSGCGAVHRGRGWVDVGARDYADVAVDAVAEAVGVHLDAEEVSWEVRPEDVDDTTVRVHCLFSGVVRGRPVEAAATVPVLIGTGTCERCGAIAGDDYAATVQVRARERDPDPDELAGAREIAREYVADREAAGDRNAYITCLSEVEGGLDVRVSTSQIGRAIADRVVERFGGRVTDSRRLITEDGDGQRVYRMAYAARLPPYRVGDVLAVDDDGPVLVEGVGAGLRGRRLTTGETYETPDPPADATVLGRVRDAAETTLVAVEDDHAVQVLDPETYESRVVARPDYLDADAETVRALRTRDGLYVLPSDAEATDRAT
jgi:nonsense-mediated mRNA decay protein 3